MVELRDTIPRLSTVSVFEMYRVAVEQATRNDIATAAAAHHELGRDYDGAVAESLVNRIGAEIDKRVDARLRAGSSVARSPAQIPHSGRSRRRGPAPGSVSGLPAW